MCIKMSFFKKILGIYGLPGRIYRQKIKMPIVRFISDTLELYKRRTIHHANNVKDVVFRASIIALVTALLVWLSVFMYVAFYYAYVPHIEHVKPVHLKFKPCEDDKGICSFPSAHVQLTKRNQLLMFGQPYRIQLHLEMPESNANQNLGMFMVCAQFYARRESGVLVANSCRSTMLTYRSPLLESIRTIIYSPMLIFGAAVQKQDIIIELFSDFQEDEDRPVTDVYVEIQTKHIELYSASLLINAHFSGLRYMMFHWPILSASIGISSNLFFIALVCLISWYQLINSDEFIEYGKSKELKNREIQSQLDLQTEGEGDSCSSMEDASLLDDSPLESSEAKSFEQVLQRLDSRKFVEQLSPSDAREVCADDSLYMVCVAHAFFRFITTGTSADFAACSLVFISLGDLMTTKLNLVTHVLRVLRSPFTYLLSMSYRIPIVVLIF